MHLILYSKTEQTFPYVVVVTLNRTAKCVKKFYGNAGIDTPDSMTMERITDLLEIELILWPFSSEIVEYKGRYKVFINENVNEQKQWQEFGHEMKHYFYDKENQKHLENSFQFYQEVKADYFAYHFCVPTFMLYKLGNVTVYDVMRIFNVEFDFAIRRIEMFCNNYVMKGDFMHARTY